MARRWSPALLAVAAVLQAAWVASDGTWLDDKFKTRGDVRADYDDSGHLITTLVLDRHSGASLISRDKYLFGRFSIEAKLVGGNSAGTVSCFYVRVLNIYFINSIRSENYPLILSRRRPPDSTS
jgi:xyloglucan:xyloglucosyl transferase